MDWQDVEEEDVAMEIDLVRQQYKAGEIKYNHDLDNRLTDRVLGNIITVAYSHVYVVLDTNIYIHSLDLINTLISHTLKGNAKRRNHVLITT